MPDSLESDTDPQDDSQGASDVDSGGDEAGDLLDEFDWIEMERSLDIEES